MARFLDKTLQPPVDESYGFPGTEAACQTVLKKNGIHPPERGNRRRCLNHMWKPHAIVQFQ